MGALKNRILDKVGNLRLNRKIQFSLLVVIIPLVLLFIMVLLYTSRYNQQYDRIITNASEAGRFSIKFKEDFDYRIYLLIAGHSSFEEDDPYIFIDNAREIADDLVKNTALGDNQRRARSIGKLLDNLEKYVRRIERNKQLGGHYDENIDIWENDVQLVTALIQATVLEYTYYETKGMEAVGAQVSKSMGDITLLSITVFAILLALAVVMSMVIPNSIAKPIHHLNDVTNQVAQGDLTVRAHVVHGAEVSQLGDSLNSMIEKIDNLLAAVKADQASLRAAELELLQAQINPHFLYNTLDTIIWLTEAGKPQEVLEVVGALSNFFRTSLGHGSGMVTLREEERHVRSYLQIQQVRYQDILDYQIDLPEGVKEALIPKITLQPLVENALYHGIKNRRGRGSIRIGGGISGSDAIITVEDDGMGMTAERLAQVRQRLQRSSRDERDKLKGDFYGLYNVNARIKLKFGEAYGLTVHSLHGQGTTVEIRIPLDLY